MRPYYDDGTCVIYHGDCREVLPTLDRFDIAVTSPPYNLNCPTKPGGGFDGMGKNSSAKTGLWHGGDLADGYDHFGDDMPMDEYDDWQREVLCDLWQHVDAIFYNHKPRPWRGEILLPLRLNPGLPLRQVIIWARAGGMNFSPSHYVPTHEWILLFAREDWRLKSKGASGPGDVWTFPAEASTQHPAPFPLTLPARVIETTGARSVIDPFLGSGTTLRAAKDAGITGVGIEVSERYCEIAARRLAQEVLDFGAVS